MIKRIHEAGSLLLSVLSSFETPLFGILSLLSIVEQDDFSSHHLLYILLSQQHLPFLSFFLFNQSRTNDLAQTILLTIIHTSTLRPSIIQLLCRSLHIIYHTFIPNFLQTPSRCLTWLLNTHTNRRRWRALRTKATPGSRCRNASMSVKI